MTSAVETIDDAALQDLVRDTELIEKTSRGDKVRRRRDGTMIKYFYLKRHLSSARWAPYAVRFCRNGAALRKLGVTSVQCTRLYRVEGRDLWLALYPELPGETLRMRLRSADPGTADKLLRRAASLLARLHQKGIYFRSVHFNNILISEDHEEYGLIDIADMKIYRHSLSLWRRARNFRHLLHDSSDRESLHAYSGKRFVQSYCQDARINGARQKVLEKMIRVHARALLTGN